MPCYLISYDLLKSRDYEPLYAAIKAYGTWAHIHESFWAVVTSYSAIQIRDDLLQHVDADDRIFVVKSGGEATWRGVICKSKWLKEHI